MEIILFVITIAVGFLADSIFGEWLNWHDAGAVFAVAVNGAVILWNMRRKQK